jgi:hypothetical protein
MAASIRSGRTPRSTDPDRSKRELMRALRDLEAVIARFVEAATDETAEHELAAFVAEHVEPKGDAPA